MITKPLVSVIMSEYNTNIDLLKESIRSILKQSYSNFEFIIIDDCGKNNMEDIIEDFNDDRIKVFKNIENSGLVFSLNKALSLAKGEFIARMDTDDYSYENRLLIQVQFLLNNPDIDLVGSNVDYYDGLNIWGHSKLSGPVTRKQILNSSPLNHPTIMAKRDVLINAGGYPNYNRCEDYALWIELFSKEYNMHNIQDSLLKYHLSEKDYKKRKLSTRQGFFELIDTQYLKLKPNRMQILKIKFKTFLAGAMPNKLIYLYHKKKMKGRYL